MCFLWLFFLVLRLSLFSYWFYSFFFFFCLFVGVVLFFVGRLLIISCSLRFYFYGVGFCRPIGLRLLKGIFAICWYGFALFFLVSIFIELCGLFLGYMLLDTRGYLGVASALGYFWHWISWAMIRGQWRFAITGAICVWVLSLCVIVESGLGVWCLSLVWCHYVACYRRVCGCMDVLVVFAMSVLVLYAWQFYKFFSYGLSSRHVWGVVIRFFVVCLGCSCKILVCGFVGLARGLLLALWVVSCVRFFVAFVWLPLRVSCDVWRAS